MSDKLTREITGSTAISSGDSIPTLSDVAKLRALEVKVDLFERVIRRFVENPFIWQSGSMRPLVEELGYEYVMVTPESGYGSPYETIRRKEPKP